MEMERLTERTHGSIADELVEEMGNPIDCVFVKDEHDTCAGICDRNAYCDDCPLNKVIRKLAEYEDAEEQGLLLRLPCPIGTTVFNTTWWDNVEERVKVNGKTFCRIVHEHKVSKSKFSYMDIEQFGKTVFLTKEEAETALAEMQKK